LPLFYPPPEDPDPPTITIDPQWGWRKVTLGILKVGLYLHTEMQIIILFQDNDKHPGL